MREKILEDLKTAMKEQNKEVLSVIRMVKGAMQLEEIKVKHNLTDEEVITIIAREIKTRKEAIIEFEKGAREDLIELNKKEIEILEKYLPEQLKEEEVEKIISDVFEEIRPAKNSDMGRIMGALTPKLKGKTDMSLVSKKVKEKLDNIKKND